MEKRNKLLEVSWDDVREQFQTVNPKLSAIIDSISPDSRFKLFKGSYAFGEQILKKGRLQVPNDKGKVVPLCDEAISKEIQDSLSYNWWSNPVSIILSGSTEIFIMLNNHVIPMYGLIPPGKVFSSWKVLSLSPSLGPAFIWDMTSGARSLFMLPKISKATSHRRIAKELGLEQEPPKNILEHWNVFREIANHDEFGEKWTSEIIFFSKDWFENLNSEDLKEFRFYLLEQAWEGSNYWRHQFIWNIVFSLIQKNQSLKLSAYVQHIIKHLFGMGIGALPGYTPAIDNSAGPVKKLQEIYISIYNLPYKPIIMQPYIFSLESERSVYFSLAFPNTIEFSEKTRADSSKLDDLLLVQSFFNKYMSGVKNEIFNIEKTPIFELSEKVNFDFYHTDFKKLTTIKDTKELAIEDKYFNIDRESIDLFPSKSGFLRGCIRISRKIKS